MRFRLYLACRNGVPLTGDEILTSGSCRGELVFESVAGELGRRFSRVARFRQIGGVTVKREIRRPLFDPVVVNIAERHIELSGFEFSKPEGLPTYQMQRWILLAPDEPPLSEYPPEHSCRRVKLTTRRDE